MLKRWLGLWALVWMLALAGCGGGGDPEPGSGGAPPTGDSTSWQPPAGATPTTGNYVYLQSQSGDYVGAGSAHLYTQATAAITTTTATGLFRVRIEGDESWTGDFKMKDAQTRLEPGTYADLTRYPFHDPAVGGLDWSGEGRGCNALSGWFVVDSVTYASGVISAIELRFEQHCDGAGAALRGKLRWSSADTTAAPGPVNPPPSDLWQPAAGATPASGNYVYLESTSGDFIGQGRTYTYTQATAVLSVAGTGGRVQVGVNGDESWSGDFQAMNSLSTLQVGYYGDLRRYPFHNPVKGGLAWGGEGRGCNVVTGWFIVDSVTYAGGTITAIELRFEQHCEGTATALRGKVRWTPADTTTPGGPVNPPPSGLWQPAAGTTPASGNYVYLESTSGDYVGAGRRYTYTQATATLSVSTTGGLLRVGVNGDEYWSGDFQAMNALSTVQAGYYGDLQRYPFHNPVKGGFDWSGEGRGCNELTGWFVVDSVTYSGSTITGIELRFEQHCEGAAAALRGKLRWSSADTTAPAGPVNPPPSGLWQPAAGATPAGGNYVYLESMSGDHVGAGRTYSYTQANAMLTLSSTGGLLRVSVDGNEYWSGDFQTMNAVSTLQVGYYGDLQRYAFHNPAKGGLDWGGEGRGCNALAGWFVVDSVTYAGSTITAIELRFEQHCEGAAAALRGKVRWSSTDTTAPAGPVNPPPSNLWQPGAGATPASGSYVYLESTSGDYVGGGRTYTYTPASATLSVSGAGALLEVGVGGIESWLGAFQAMNAVSTLQPGYYGDLQRYPFHNPTAGGLSWSGEGRGCNELAGWFAVDNVTYAGNSITAIELRFEQRCDASAGVLHGKIRWAAGG